MRSVVVCENNSVYLSCPAHYMLYVDSAVYGRLDTKICTVPKMGLNSCKPNKSDPIVKKNCNGKNECYLESSSEVFGDPCPGTLKYLEVWYTCNAALEKRFISRLGY